MSDFKWYGAERKRDLKDRMRTNMGIAVSSMDADIKSSMKNTPRGESDPTARSGSRSLPGHPPAVQTATLIGSVFSTVDEDEKGIFGVVGSKDAVQAKAMEFGLPGKNVAPRPWLFPAYARLKKNLMQILKK